MFQMASTSASGASRIAASEVTHTEEREKRRQAAAPYQKGRAAKSKSTTQIPIEQDNLHNKYLNDVASATQPVGRDNNTPSPPPSIDIHHITGGRLVPVREGSQKPQYPIHVVHFKVNGRLGICLGDVSNRRVRQMDGADTRDFAEWKYTRCHLNIQVCHQQS